MAAEKEVTNVKAYLKVSGHSDGCGIVKDHGDEFKVIVVENEVTVPFNTATGKTTGATHFTGFKVAIPWSKGVATLLTDMSTNKKIGEIVLASFDVNNEKEAAIKATFKNCQLIGHKIAMGSDDSAAGNSANGQESIAELVFSYTDLKYEFNNGEGTAKSSFSAD